MLGTAALVLWIPGCAVACWWQIGVGRSGDSLGWVYAVMWPCFAVFGTIFWWHLVHDDPDVLGRRGLQCLHPDAVAAPRAPAANAPQAKAAADDAGRAEGADEADDAIRRAEEDDPELAAYNRYLAALSRQDRASERRDP